MLHMLEPFFLRIPRGMMSLFRISLYRILGMSIGKKNRMENGRCRRVKQILIGSNNAFTQGFMIWPEDADYGGFRIQIGDNNYFNRNVMLDACGQILIGHGNMFGPDVYVTDSNHKYVNGISSKDLPMDIGKVVIGNNCWIGAKATILKNVELGDNCIVAAGAVVTISFPAGSVLGGVPAKLIKNII